MKIETRSFEEIFDGTTSFVPRAIVDLNCANMPVVQDLLRSQATHGHDGLDAFRAVLSS